LREGFLASLVVSISLLLLVLSVVLGFYIYHSFAWQRIARKQKYKKPWLAWIPFANTSMIFQMAGFHWAWIFLVLVPVFGWVAVFALSTISIWRIFEKEKYPGWLSLSLPMSLLPNAGFFFGIIYLIILGFVAWEKRKK
jgi:hypothetical protein